jgi:hypothetical protein
MFKVILSIWGLLILVVLLVFGWKGIVEIVFYALLILPFALRKQKWHKWTPSEKFLIDPDLAISEGEKETEVHETHDPRW